MPDPKSARAKNRASATSMSAKIHVTTVHRSQSGRVMKERRSLTASKVRQAKAEETRREAERLEAMTVAQRRNVELLQNFGDTFDDDDRYEQDILHGRTAADISHVGEALPPDEADAADAALMAGLPQLERMADAYLEFSLAIADEGLMASPRVPENADVQETRDLLVVNMFSASHEDLKMIGADAYIASACVRQGWMPCAPYFPTVVITICALEVYRITRLRCPRLGIQVFVRALCDIHGVAPRPWLGTQFSVAFDVYLAVRARVDRRVHVALGRDAPDWRLKNTCPACLYKLEGEPRLKFPLMCTFDGNNSLSRFWAREREVSLADGTTAPGASKELLDDRVAPGDYYLRHDEVNEWEKDGVSDVLKSFSPDAEGEEDIVCSDSWQNMKEDVTARVYGMYDETGFFPALCRHGFVLKVVDVVKSGELSKYPLAIMAHLLNILGEVAIGYDIGCKFDKMVKVHPALKELAADKNFRALVAQAHVGLLAAFTAA
ncbi:hypothetical protein B0H14DRAFT_3154471 [Mycena olivaceomarginata]|nr:hypothetical protein B0H14DRAFT_3154471 [Mycena olivaceomarginata]